MITRYDVLIVGGGHGGAQTAIALRQQGFRGSIAIVGDEPHPPYERPPLSKEYLARDKDFSRILIRPEKFWSDKEIDLLLGQKVIEIEVEAHRALLANGSAIQYSNMVWSAGGAPRRLTCSGHDARGVHTVRTRADVDALMAELANVKHVVVIGAGFIGLEAAAVLTKLGKSVTVVEAQDRVLARVAGEPLSRFFEAEHRSHGVDLRLCTSVDCIEQRDGLAVGVRLASGEILPCEMIIVGIGITPAVAPLIEAGATGANGVEVDEHCRTSLPDVFAIGDCAAHRSQYADGALVRVESVQNASDQAIIVAKAIRGVPEPYSAIPWFWSNQYDLKLQTVGLSTGYEMAIVRGDLANRNFTVIYVSNNRIIALDCVNRTKDYVQGKALIQTGVDVSNLDLTDDRVPLKQFGCAT
ncbi:MAG: pyridine nucleotide-disulfide oxidoreductase [Sphingomonas hengshuiensis]|uniref:Pyridine nucleotide-disulfide oxidoreductase n=1 Tax=Sphingomonas hengshuiensis TaxID=1609977 RepID=A0A2W5B328_9SPHN|nr:MAG: pyridine nucleotide-disulfide oxidoreductase [Sphingomonas hengshuiensis]